jgi:hypothetical protein
MKQLFLIAACLLTLGAQAQQPTIPSGIGSYAGKVFDSTITNVGTPQIVVPITENKSAITFIYRITKTSGTLSGTIVLSGAAVAKGVTPAAGDYAVINSYTITDATATTSLAYSAANYTHYKVVITTGSSQVANYKINVLYRQ